MVKTFAKLILVFSFLNFLFSTAVFSGEPNYTPAGGLENHGLSKEEIISADDLRQMQKRKEQFLLLDARNTKKYEEIHIQGAQLPLGKFFQQMEMSRQGVIAAPPDREKILSEYMQKYPKNTPIVTYCNANCHLSASLLLDLKKLGFMNLRSMEEGVQEWEKKGYPVEIGAPLSVPSSGVPVALATTQVSAKPAPAHQAGSHDHGLNADEIISMEQLKKRIDSKEKLLILDARDVWSYNSLHMAGAIMPFTEEFFKQFQQFRQGIVPSPPDREAALKKFISRYPKNTPIVTYCNANCGASAVLALSLKKLGYKNVKSMEEGIQPWESKGYPVVKKA